MFSSDFINFCQLIVKVLTKVDLLIVEMKGTHFYSFVVKKGRDLVGLDLPTY
jgi:hypothetical protein